MLDSQSTMALFSPHSHASLHDRKAPNDSLIKSDSPIEHLCKAPDPFEIPRHSFRGLDPDLEYHFDLPALVPGNTCGRRKPRISD